MVCLIMRSVVTKYRYSKIWALNSIVISPLARKVDPQSSLIIFAKFPTLALNCNISSFETSIHKRASVSTRTCEIKHKLFNRINSRSELTKSVECVYLLM